jgi:hypothetical protein
VIVKATTPATAASSWKSLSKSSEPISACSVSASSSPSGMKTISASCSSDGAQRQ